MTGVQFLLFARTLASLQLGLIAEFFVMALAIIGAFFRKHSTAPGGFSVSAAFLSSKRRALSDTR